MNSEPGGVNDLLAWLRSDVLAGLGELTVSGELIEIRHSKAGAHGELAQRDSDGRLIARFPWVARWAVAQRLKGLQGHTVEMVGTLTSHHLYGPLRLSVDDVRAIEGPAEKAEAAAALAAAAQARLEMPSVIRRVGVVAPRSSAGREDFYEALGEVLPAVEEHRTAMAGAAAGAHIARAILVAAHRCDLVIALRGGGAVADLAAWNRPAVVEAIGAAKVPVVVAVGHTRNHHLADDASWLSLPTPTSAGRWLRDLISVDR